MQAILSGKRKIRQAVFERIGTANTIEGMSTEHPDYVREEAARLKAIYNDRKRKDKTLNQGVLAELCGWSSQGTVSQYMTGELALNHPALLRFSAALGFDPAEVSPRLAGQYQAAKPAEPARAGDDTGQYAYVRGRVLPVLGYVQAGAFCEAADRSMNGNIEEWVESGGPVGPRAFVVRVEGRSMTPKLLPGELVVIDPDLAWVPGNIVLAKRLSDQHVTIKTLCKEGNEYYLEAANPDWPDRIIRMTEEWVICGRARRKIAEL